MDRDTGRTNVWTHSLPGQADWDWVWARLFQGFSAEDSHEDYQPPPCSRQQQQVDSYDDIHIFLISLFLRLAVAIGNDQDLRFNLDYPQFLVPLTYHQLLIVVHFLEKFIYSRLLIADILADIIYQI